MEPAGPEYRLWSWGLGKTGQLGHGSRGSIFAPKPIETLDGFDTVEVRGSEGVGLHGVFTAFALSPQPLHTVVFSSQRECAGRQQSTLLGLDLHALQ